MFGFFKQKSQEESKMETDKTTRKQGIANAKQIKHETHRKPNPQQDILFQEEDFIDFRVVQENNLIKLHTYRYNPPENVKPNSFLFLFHGLNSHQNLGAHIAKEFAEIGCIVTGFDHRGFGKSQGITGYLESLQTHLADSNEFIDKVLSHYQTLGLDNLPIFLAGLSMGGLTSFRLSIQRPQKFRGIILFAPALKPMASKSMITFTNVMAKVLFILYYLFQIIPKVQLIKPQKGIVTKNPQISEDIQKDPHVYHENMRPKTLSTMLSAMDESQRMYHLLTVPWIVVQGGVDKLVDPDLALELEKVSPSKDKTVIYYENCWHDIWHEEEIFDALPKVVEWVKQRAQ